MLATNFLLPILGLAHVTFAFFPYQPAWRCVLDDTCVSTKRSEPETGANAAFKRDDFTLSLRQSIPDFKRRQTSHAESVNLLAARLKNKRGTPVERRGRYSIASASVPSQTLSAGIDQDGTDYSYFAEVQLGTKTEPYYMLLDTGAGQSWVMGSSCTSTPCTMHNTFGPEDSTTYKVVGGDFSVQYGTGNVSGLQITDSVSFAGLKLNMTFGVANHTSDEFSSFPIDGIIGLSRMTSTYSSFIQSLASSNALKSNIFGVAINRAADGPNTGEINFGQVDSSKFTGDLSYTPVSTNSELDWALPMDNMGVGNKKSAMAKGKLGYIDTGTSFVFASEDEVKTFHAVVPGAASSDGQTYTVPCDMTASMFLTFSGVTYNISSKDWVGPKVKDVCTSNVYGIEVVPGAWLLGDVFLKNVYAVFDIDQSRVGFAVKNVPVVTSPTSSSATGGPLSTSTSPTGVPASSSASGPGSTLGTNSNGKPTGSSTASLPTATTTGGSTTVSTGMNGHQTSTSANSGSGSAAAESSPSASAAAAAAADQKGTAAVQFNTGILAAILGTLLVTVII